MSTTDKIFSFIVFILILFYVKNQYYAEVEIVYSKIDNRPYVVKSLPNKQRAADLLAKMNRRLILLVEHPLQGSQAQPMPSGFTGLEMPSS